MWHTVSKKISQSILALHAQFRGHPFFGPLVFILLTVPLLLPPMGGASTDAIKYSCLLFGFGLFLLSVKRENKGFTNSVITWWLAAWLVWVSITTIVSRDPLYAFLGSYPRYNSSWMVYCGFAGLLAVVVYLGRSYTRVLVGLLLTVSFCVAGFGLLQSFGFGFYAGLENLLSSILPRVPSLLGNPNFSGWWIAAALPFSLLALIRARSITKRVACIVLVFVLCWSLVVFSSRGAILAAACGFAVFFVFTLLLRQWRVALVLLIFAAIAGLIFTSYYNLYRPSQEGSITQAQDSSANERYIPWFMAGEFWQTHKLFGIGPGNFDQYYWENLPNNRMGGEQYFDDPHNILLSILADLGSLGFILFAALFGLAAACSLRLLRESADPQEWTAAASGVAAWLVAGLFNPAVLPLWVLLALLMGIIFIHYPAVATTMRLSRPGVWLLRVVGIGFCWLAVAFTVGEYALVYSIAWEAYRGRTPEALEKQRSYTTIANAIEPFHMETRYAELTTRIFAGAPPEEVRSQIDAVFALHPASCRAALLAAQVFAEVWFRSNDEVDLRQAEHYLDIALSKSAGYPVVQSWAAYFYWRANNPVLAKQYIHYAILGQPQGYNNWLLLAKIYREDGNLPGVMYALAKAQGLAPSNADLAKRRKELEVSKDINSFDIFPGEPSVLTRLH